jgi:hypothetical protein
MARQVVEILILGVYVKRLETLLVSGLHHLNPRLTIRNNIQPAEKLAALNPDPQLLSSTSEFYRLTNFSCKTIYHFSLLLFFASGGYPFLLSAMLCSTSINSTLLKIIHQVDF